MDTASSSDDAAAMMPTDTHRRCMLRRVIKQSSEYLMVWIPEPLAEIGKKLKLFRSGAWRENWVVLHIEPPEQFLATQGKIRNYLDAHNVAEM